MNTPVTVIAPIKLAAGKTERDLLAASEVFQADFVSKQAGILRRELVRTGPGTYLDIVQFSSEAEAQNVLALEANSTACLVFFAVMDLTGEDASKMPDLYPSLATFG